MAKHKYKKSGEKSLLIKTETKHGVIAVAFLALAIFFVLAGFNYAGIAGEKTYQLLGRLLGSGFFIIPVSLLLLSASFLKNRNGNFVTGRLIAGAIFFVSALGLLGVAFSAESKINGGWMGLLIARPLLKLFDAYSLILLLAVMAISLLIIFDRKPRLPSWLFVWRQKSVIPEPPVSVKGPEAVGPSQTEPETTAGEKPSTAQESPEKTKTPAEWLPFGKLLVKSRRPEQDFTPPPLELLAHDSGKPAAGDVKANANIIKRTLANFGIVVEMDEVSIGPSITRYALKPAEGVKLSRIVALQNDLSLALAAHPLRIEAPIPGKSLVGIEIPNNAKTLVGLGSLLASGEFANAESPLWASLGRDISGRPHFANLAKAPHFLVAGTTGSGKSVIIHTFIVSLLYRNSPDWLRLIMIDPKRVELTGYNSVPHLLTPVITDPKKAILVLKWAIKEMERRYELLEEASARDIVSYHKQGGEKPEAEKMPYIVIVIDELADIMSRYPRELEAAVVRLAQMSRAVGIHLVLSTQRPSVEVLTGLIKANIPTRIALQVASQVDSRTILDLAGAEKLLGAGDFLYLSAEMSKPVRLQAAFISETEVKKVVNYLAEQYADRPEEKTTELVLAQTEQPPLDAALAIGDDDDEVDDELYQAARETVVGAGKASASYLQRKLKIGYARAARLLDMLEERGVIGPGQGAKQRTVYEQSAAEERI